MRWQDRDGLIPPAGFIPLAEDLGLIDDIGAWVVREGCRQQLEWRNAGSRAGMSFNLSLRELWQPEIVERIAAQARGAGLEPTSLIVEITESTAMTDPTRTQRVLYELRRHGFSLAIDDFGAGHSSFSRLAELHCEILKIDRSFVARLPGDASSAAMVTAMLELAERARYARDRRGHRDRGAARVPHRARVPARPGIPLRAAGAGGGCRAEPARGLSGSGSA